MKSFEQWWLKYYKYGVLAGLFFLVLQVFNNGLAGFDVKGAIIFFAIITSPVGALIGQVSVWLVKVLKLLFDIFRAYLTVRKERKQ